MRYVDNFIFDSAGDAADFYAELNTLHPSI